MSISCIHGQPLEVTVVSCQKLKDTEWISRQDPYARLEYGSAKFQTRTCTDGGRNPTFQEKFVFSLIEGLREMNVAVWNSNTITYDDFIGSGKVILNKVLSEGYDDSSWPLQTKTGRNAGEIRLIMHYANAKKPPSNYASSAPPYMTSPYATTPPPVAPYPTPPPYHPPSPYSSYVPPSGAYAPPPESSLYPPPYGAPSAYPPPTYPPVPYSLPCYPPGHYPGPPGSYPPPNY